MTKAELIEEIVRVAGVEKPVAAAVVEGVMDCIKNSLGQGSEVFLRGFGTFQLKKRAAKTGRNISKGTSVKIPAHVIPAFKPAKELKKLVAKRVK
jgi:DNA-binding protein HU-beta